MHFANGVGDDAGFGGDCEVGRATAPVYSHIQIHYGQRGRRKCLPLFYLRIFCANEGQKFVASLFVVAEAA
jgi:hypothetical protein